MSVKLSYNVFSIILLNSFPILYLDNYLIFQDFLNIIPQCLLFPILCLKNH